MYTVLGAPWSEMQSCSEFRTSGLHRCVEAPAGRSGQAVQNPAKTQEILPLGAEQNSRKAPEIKAIRGMASFPRGG